MVAAAGMQALTARPFGTWRRAPRSGRRSALEVTSAAAPGPKLNVHVGETTIAFPLQRPQAQQLQAALTTVMQTFAEKQKAERPKRWDSMEYRYKGEPGSEDIDYLEVFCNPNAHPTAFDAKFLMTLTAGGIKVTTEGKLSALKADVDTYLEHGSG